MRSELAAVGAGAAAAGAAAAVAQAIRASGAIVRIYPQDFLAMLSRNVGALVQSHGGILSSKYQSLTSYKGLVLYTESQTMLQLPGGIELLTADKIWIPG